MVALGKTHRLDAAGTDYDSQYAYTTRRLDDETDLMYYRARYYHSELGRFVGRDPVGLGGGFNAWQIPSTQGGIGRGCTACDTGSSGAVRLREGLTSGRVSLIGGMNLYEYVGDRPTVQTDPTGLWPLGEEEKNMWPLDDVEKEQLRLNPLVLNVQRLNPDYHEHKVESVPERIQSGYVPIIHGGGWTTKEIVGRPKARFCGFLSAIWLLVFIPAFIFLWVLWSSPPPLSWAVWVGCVLLIPEPLFLALALASRHCEKPKKMTVVRGRTSGDPRMLK